VYLQKYLAGFGFNNPTQPDDASVYKKRRRNLVRIIGEFLEVRIIWHRPEFIALIGRGVGV